MTTDHHSPIATGAAANANTFNGPLSAIDAAIGDFSAHTGSQNLADWITSLVLAGGVVSTTLNTAEAPGGTFMGVASTAGFTDGMPITITLDNGDLHTTTVVDVLANDLQIADVLPSAASIGNVVSATIEEVRQARGTPSRALGVRMTEMERTARAGAGLPSAIWEAPTQPNYSSYAVGYAGNEDDYREDLWEPLAAAHPTYITVSTLGQDQSGTYNIHKYVFEPETGYEKTIVCLGAVHGTEVLGMLGLYRFLYHVCNDWYTYPQLAYIRHKVRLVVIPMVNPWGVTNANRKNSRGVDINRNYDYNWASYTDGGPSANDYKGTAAFSEAETQIVRDLLIAYAGEFHAMLDCHNGGPEMGHYISYTASVQDTDNEPFYRIVNHFLTGAETQSLQYSDNPSSIGYAADTYGVHAVNPEFAASLRTGTSGDATDMQAVTNFMGNMILGYAALPGRPPLTVEREPFIYRVTYFLDAGTALTTTSTSYVEFTDFALSFDVPCNGYVELLGEIQARIVGIAPMLADIAPAISQQNSGFGTAASQNRYGSAGRANVDNGGVAFPFRAEAKVWKTGEHYGPVLTKIWVKVSGGELRVRHLKYTVKFTPSERFDRLRNYQVTLGAGVTQVYPT